MKKYIIPVAAFIAGLAIVPSVFATPNDGKSLGKVSDAKGVNGTATTATLTSPKDEAETIDIDFTSATLTYSDEYESKGDYDPARPAGYAWLQFKMTRPSDNYSEPKATVTMPGVDPVLWNTVKNGSGSDEATFLKKIVLDDVEAAARAGETNLVYTYIFDWNGADTEGGIQTVNLKINLQNLTIYTRDVTDFEGEDDLIAQFTAFDNAKYLEYVKAGPVADDPTDEPADDDNDGETNPNTADSIATYLTIATVALLGLGATAFVAKKSNR